jgi:hypothetical protein
MIELPRQEERDLQDTTRLISYNDQFRKERLVWVLTSTSYLTADSIRELLGLTHRNDDG